ncbi:MAG: PDZ domain-containing protein [Bdellovibrionales bacterium]|nr:PDZ domain-containing protein [Bdellovibrionales bacterium]
MKSILALLILGSFSLAQADSYVGFGFTIQKQKDDSDVQIIDLIENGPAMRAGINVGEFLTHIDGQETQPLKLEEVSKLLRGDVDEVAVLTMRTGVDGPSREVRVAREIITRDCFLEGSVSLNFRQTSPGNGWLSGWIGNEYVRLDIFGRRATGYVKNEYVSLNYDDWGSTPTSRRIELNGYIHNTYVSWRGWNDYVSGYQSCIP